MFWLDLVMWVIGRGVIAGAIVGAILGTLFALIAGTIFGLVIGGFVGAILGLIDGIALAIITHYAYTPASKPNRYPQLIYSVSILINISPVVVLFLLGIPSITWDHVITCLAIIWVPITIMGVITAYCVGLFLEFTDQLMMQKPISSANHERVIVGDPN